MRYDHRVYIIVLNWNGWKDTAECLDSLCNLSHHNYRMVVCDNGSTDDSLYHLREWAKARFGDASERSWCSYDRATAERGGDPAVDPTLVLIENAHNLGYGGGNNVGMRYALARGDASCFWLLNNDTVVKEHALTALMARLEERPAAGMCGSTIRYYQHRDRIQALGGARYFSLLGVAWHIGRGERGESTADPEQIESKLSYIVGASLLVSRLFVEDIGLLAEDYFLYFEEIDWAWRAKGRYTLAFAPDSVVYHKVGASIGTRTAPWRKSRICDYFTLRNRIVFTRRYCPWALPTIYAVLLGEFLLRVAVGRWDLAKQVAILFLQIPNGSADGLIKS